mmetsp:Transcript_22787/g.56462  ORF Transcript_22787/g.56462 Transcript_22787/m.56462 type:complete len:465 (+) Transcript_22787:100-1494(+)
MNGTQQPRVDFSNMVGPKRRRMRSGGNVSTITNNAPKEMQSSVMTTSVEDEKLVQTSKCKGSTTIPIFLKKTYKMIESSPPEIAAWTPDGEMFVVKDPDEFATQIIPQYFDHNKFSSFARQLNFYGFRKMQSKPIRNSDFDANTAKHVTFYNENFKRGRHDLLKKIQRSTRGGGNSAGQDQQREIQQLKEKVMNLEKTVQDLTAQQEERMRRLELDMLGRMEQMMLAMQQQQQHNQHAQFHQLRKGGNNIGANSMSADLQSAQNLHNGMNGMNGGPSLAKSMGESFDPLPYGSRGASISTMSGLAHLMGNQASMGMKNGVTGAPGVPGGPTLPPHPKQKQLGATQGLPGNMGLPPARMDSLRGISALSRGISTLSRGLSTESQGGINAFEDKFFSMLMNGDNKQQFPGGGVPGSFNPTPMPGSNNLMGNGSNNINSAMNGRNGMGNSNNKIPIPSQNGSSNTNM